MNNDSLENGDPYMADARPKARNMVGFLILISGLFVYMFSAAALGGWLEEKAVNKWLQIVYYLIAGLAWLYPARWVFKWIAKK